MKIKALTIAIVAALSITAGAQSVTINGITYAESTNSAGQTVLTPTGTNTATLTLSPLSTNGNAFTTVFDYFTSFNTNLSICFATNMNYQAWIGASYQSSTYLGGVVGEEIQPINKVHGLTLRAVETLAPQVGTLTDAELDLGYSFVYVDTRTTPFVGVDLINKDGQANTPEAACFSYGVEFEKAVAHNAFGGVYIEGRTRTKGALIFGFFTGMTF